MSEKSLVYVVENDRLTPDPLRRLVESLGYPTHQFRSTAEFVGGLQASLSGCCALLDFEAPVLDGLYILRRLAESRVVIPVLVAVGDSQADIVCEALRLGAVEVLQKPVASGRLQLALSKAQNCPAPDDQLSEARSCFLRMQQLSKREQAIVFLAAEGIPNKSIAAKFNCSTKTVEKWRRCAYHTLGVASTAEMTRVVVLGRLYPGYQRLAAQVSTPMADMPPVAAAIR